jgi:hypothetical protein
VIVKISKTALLTFLETTKITKSSAEIVAAAGARIKMVRQILNVSKAQNRNRVNARWKIKKSLIADILE